MVIHGFIDGFSRLITGLRVRNNNRADTVEATFHEGRHVYGCPRRVRGDHGRENLRVAEWMFERYGLHTGAYIWGRYKSALLSSEPKSHSWLLI
jgi:transposase InsO family protein